MTECHVGDGVSSVTVVGTLHGSFQPGNENLGFILCMILCTFTSANLYLSAPKAKKCS